MHKLVKFLKPFILPLLVAIGLLYAQAMTDLALPDYMSNIVNTGIQQGGVEHAVPNILKQSDMDKLILFLNEDNKEKVNNSYDLINPSDREYEDYLETYPNLDGEVIYTLKDIDKSEVNELNPIMAKALLSVEGINKMMDDANGGDIEINGMKIPAGTDLFVVLGQMPVEQRNQMMEGASKQFEMMDEAMTIQAGISVVQKNYEVLGMDTEKIQRNYILKIGGIMLLVSLLGAVCSITVGFIAAKIAGGLGRNLRKNIFTKVSGFSNREFDKFSTASLITRSTNDVTQIQTLMVIMIRMVFYAPIIGIGGIIKATSKNSSMSWIIAIAVIILLGLIAILFSIVLPKFKMVQKLVDRLNMVTRENLSGMMVIRAFNTQKFEEQRFNKANEDLTKTNLFVNRVMVFLFPAMNLIMNGVTLLIVWVGAHQIADSAMQVGDMMAFMQYALQIIFAFLMLSMMFIMIPRASVSAQRIAEVLETEPTIIDPKEPKHFDEDLNGVVEFKDVSFRYPGAQEDMIKKISFKAEPGKTTAIIGSTGSGKTTLMNLIPRFYDVTSGKVTIDDIDIRDLTQHEVRDVIGYVPQKASLFSGTIESNLKYGDENASSENLKESAEIAQAMDFINEKPEGFDTEISQGGTNVSGGQKQRLSIARALAKKPKIFIFDDSFSALDFKTDSALRRALKEKTGDSTMLIVAQRISTIKKAEQIIVLDDGKMVGLGTHEELMKTCETYQEIALSQLSKEELS
ncbi:ABC transporter ATP-binding protein [Oceanirhabdus seepicola]|uniref:ABC transporter ATP-binding protein n=1 Tax=Oceanirhabdus seepicola TaxID=2828781 RepID=A0A9J6P7F6_9CLOT|nr:ABC transporter ATP-binding protein [Oceanirhabdus seepicola]MCM1991440.1 ABC transporter ATP-binding protein [Oceanirhabdus seepicola]